MEDPDHGQAQEGEAQQAIFDCSADAAPKRSRPILQRVCGLGATWRRRQSPAGDRTPGGKPASLTLSGRGLAVKDIWRAFRARQKIKVDSSEVGAPWFEDCWRMVTVFTRAAEETQDQHAIQRITGRAAPGVSGSRWRRPCRTGSMRWLITSGASRLPTDEAHLSIVIPPAATLMNGWPVPFGVAEQGVTHAFPADAIAMCSGARSAG